MKKRLTIFLTIGSLFLIAMCTNNSSAKKSYLLPPMVNADTIKKYTEATRFVDDSFISSVLDSDAVLKKLKLICNNKCKPTIKVVNNKYSAGQKDSIYSFYDNKDTVTFYLTKGKEIPLKIVVNSPRITFDSDIRLGINKKYFKDKFKVPKVTDLFFIQDLEAGCVIMFEFRNDILIRMTLTGNID